MLYLVVHLLMNIAILRGKKKKKKNPVEYKTDLFVYNFTRE